MLTVFSSFKMYHIQYEYKIRLYASYSMARVELSNMLSMVIFTFKPEKKDDVLKRSAEEDTIIDVKNIGEWCSVETGRIFRVVEGGNLGSTLEALRTWGHLGKIEVVPVKKVEEVIGSSGQLIGT
jgi:hypothetical protein